MSMLNYTSSTFVTTGAIAQHFEVMPGLAGHMINGYIAKLIAQREQQANLVILRYLADRELRDMGLNRSQIGEGLAEAAKDRSALQEALQRQSMMSQ